MTSSVWFWLFYVFSFVFFGWRWWPYTPERAPWLVIYILIGLLGWQVFGSPLK